MKKTSNKLLAFLKFIFNLKCPGKAYSKKCYDSNKFYHKNLRNISLITYGQNLTFDCKYFME